MKYNQSQLSYISLDSLLFICRDCTQHALKNTVVKFLQFGRRKYYIIISKRKFILYQGSRANLQTKVWQRNMVYHNQQFHPKREKRSKLFDNSFLKETS